jgi:hypothetical protein
MRVRILIYNSIDFFILTHQNKYLMYKSTTRFFGILYNFNNHVK